MAPSPLQADTDGSGLLNRKEFKAALMAAELGLTRKDINLILTQVYVVWSGSHAKTVYALSIPGT